MLGLTFWTYTPANSLPWPLPSLLVQRPPTSRLLPPFVCMVKQDECPESLPVFLSKSIHFHCKWFLTLPRRTPFPKCPFVFAQPATCLLSHVLPPSCIKTCCCIKRFMHWSCIVLYPLLYRNGPTYWLPLPPPHHNLIRGLVTHFQRHDLARCHQAKLLQHHHVGE